MSLIRHGATIDNFTKRAREDLGLTQQEFGKKLFYSYQVISDVETGRRRHPIAFCYRLAEFLRKKKDFERLKTLEIIFDQILSDAIVARFER